LVWPAIVLLVVVLGALASLIIRRDAAEIRLAVTRSNLILMALSLVAPPAGLTVIWLRMRRRRHPTR
jgi:hypothetical protein